MLDTEKGVKPDIRTFERKQAALGIAAMVIMGELGSGKGQACNYVILTRDRCRKLQ